MTAIRDHLRVRVRAFTTRTDRAIAAVAAAARNHSGNPLKVSPATAKRRAYAEGFLAGVAHSRASDVGR
jgi:hypothetical protein